MNSYSETLSTSLRTLTIQPKDEALVRLAVGYAVALDEGGELRDLGPKYQQALTALGLAGATPRGGEVVDHGAVTPLQRLRDAARERRGEAVHAPTA